MVRLYSFRMMGNNVFFGSEDELESQGPAKSSVGGSSPLTASKWASSLMGKCFSCKEEDESSSLSLSTNRSHGVAVTHRPVKAES